MASQYVPEYPDLPFDPEYKAFIESFYRASDDAQAPYSSYADFFTDDAKLKIGPKSAEGREGRFPSAGHAYIFPRV
jgi:hypothetical protein